MLKQGLIDRPRSCQRLRGSFEIDRVPKRDGSDNEVQPAGVGSVGFQKK